MKLPKQKIIEGAIVLRAMAIAFFAFGALLWIPAVMLYRDSEAAVGTVVSLVEQSDSEHSTCRFPIFKFTDPQGVEHTVTSSSGSEPPKYLPGELIPIRYDWKHPDDARPADFFTLWGMPLLLQGLGVFYFLLASVVLHFLRKQSAPQPGGLARD